MSLCQITSDNPNYRTLSGFTGALVIDMQNADRYKSPQCRRIMLALRRQNGARSHDTGMERERDTNERHFRFLRMSSPLALLNWQQEAGVEICRLIGLYGYHNL